MLVLFLSECGQSCALPGTRQCRHGDTDLRATLICTALDIRTTGAIVALFRIEDRGYRSRGGAAWRVYELSQKLRVTRARGYLVASQAIILSGVLLRCVRLKRESSVRTVVLTSNKVSNAPHACYDDRGIN